MSDGKKKQQWRWILLVQGMVMLYSFVSVLSKIASGRIKNGLFSFEFLSVVCLMVLVLGIYAICWQKVLKHVDLSIAYANKGIGLFWSLLWSVLLFDETIKINNIIGLIIIIIGIMVVTTSNE